MSALSKETIPFQTQEPRFQIMIQSFDQHHSMTKLISCPRVEPLLGLIGSGSPLTEVKVVKLAVIVSMGGLKCLCDPRRFFSCSFTTVLLIILRPRLNPCWSRCWQGSIRIFFASILEILSKNFTMLRIGIYCKPHFIYRLHFCKY